MALVSVLCVMALSSTGALRQGGQASTTQAGYLHRRRPPAVAQNTIYTLSRPKGSGSEQPAETGFRAQEWVLVLSQ